MYILMCEWMWLLIVVWGRNISLTTDVNYTGPVSVVFQDRTINMTNGVIRDIITGYGSVVYRFPPIKST